MASRLYSSSLEVGCPALLASSPATRGPPWRHHVARATGRFYVLQWTLSPSQNRDLPVGRCGCAQFHRGLARGDYQGLILTFSSTVRFLEQQSGTSLFLASPHRRVRSLETLGSAAARRGFLPRPLLVSPLRTADLLRRLWGARSLVRFFEKAHALWMLAQSLDLSLWYTFAGKAFRFIKELDSAVVAAAE